MSVQPGYGPAWGTKLYRYYFTPRTPNIGTGALVTLPDPSSVILQAAIEVIQAFNGTTPKADFVFEAAPTAGVFAAMGPGAVAVDLTAAGARLGNLETKSVSANLFLTTDNPTIQSTDAILLSANQTGLPGGASSASTQGQANLYLLVGSPVSLN